MPIYDYECAGCGHQFELRQGFDAEPVEVCPRCQGRAQRRFHSVAVIYKGNGFYTTDYGRKSVSEPAKSSESPSTEAAEKSPASVSSTPAEGSKESPSATV